MNTVPTETIAIISFALLFAGIIAAMVVKAVRTKDNSSRFRIVGRTIGVAAIFIAFVFFWLTSKH